MIQVSIEEVQQLAARRREINHLKLEEIEWTVGGRPFPVDPKQLEEFRFTGLCNTNFVEMEFWRGPDEVTTFEAGVGAEVVVRPPIPIGQATSMLAEQLKDDLQVWSVGYTQGTPEETIVIHRATAPRHALLSWEGFPVEVLVSSAPTMS